jgi:preprotein translocase subunit SecD
MLRIRLIALLVLVSGLGVGYFLYDSERGGFGSEFPFQLGLDLAGGTHLVYRADVSEIEPSEVKEAMESLRDVLERRVNLFGVAEPVVQVETTLGLISERKDNRLIIELPGVTNVDEATDMIGKTPTLEFRLENENEVVGGDVNQTIRDAIERQDETFSFDELFLSTGLTGRLLERATLGFDSVTSEAQVLLDFNKEGKELFAEITRENVGRTLAIYLDGAPISMPVIREEISGGQAQISGNFTPESAKQLVGRLNSGALPVPIELLGSQTVGATLGKESVERGLKAGVLGLIAVSFFMLLWYRLPGLVAICALGIYISLMLAIFKLIPVTLTAAGIAGFILSIGMAVDANVLIFERSKEELRNGKNVREAIFAGFSRAWVAIRDANVTSFITAVILFWFGTSLVEGFALVFGLGVLLSMLTAVSVTRTLLIAVSKEESGRVSSLLFNSGFFAKQPNEMSTPASSGQLHDVK